MLSQMVKAKKFPVRAIESKGGRFRVQLFKSAVMTRQLEIHEEDLADLEDASP